MEKVFGIQVNEKPALINARVLPSPKLEYHRTSRVPIECPTMGRWKSITRESLLAFIDSTGRRSERIIFYRHGVSEDQFSQVLLYEMDAIRKLSNCKSLLLPGLCLNKGRTSAPSDLCGGAEKTYTRLFPAKPDQKDKSVNIPPVPPVHYAHLVAFRARCYIQGETSESGSTSGTGSQVEVRALPLIKDNV
ncbi:Protein argonaute MEL1 [Morella rubra]|uniref:Protein argonaute MEL1 n=1 Tax=Morella rubra TaxID=262757 RepID=A0A6A1WHU4_9ROSI|nr:Protein argonaute MEL1 [Morella rubra]